MPKAPTLTDTEELEVRILAVLAEAERPMDRDDITAVAALRICAERDQAMARLIFEGRVVATLRPGCQDDLLDVDSYVFRTPAALRSSS